MNEYTIVTILICAGLLAFFMLMYLEGRFSYNEEIHSKRRYTVTAENMLGRSVYEVERIVIKRTYHSGKIKFIEKEVRI